MPFLWGPEVSVTSSRVPVSAMGSTCSTDSQAELSLALERLVTLTVQVMVSQGHRKGKGGGGQRW